MNSRDLLFVHEPKHQILPPTCRGSPCGGVASAAYACHCLRSSSWVPSPACVEELAAWVGVRSTAACVPEPIASCLSARSVLAWEPVGAHVADVGKRWKSPVTSRRGSRCRSRGSRGGIPGAARLWGGPLRPARPSPWLAVACL